MLDILTRKKNIDKSIILGPTKTNFASSLYGGLKRTDDGSNLTKNQQSTSRHNRQVKKKAFYHYHGLLLIYKYIVGQQ